MKNNHKTRMPFQGFQGPNYTMVPDELFDELLPDLSGAELKVALYICRRTFGFKKDEDSISLSQLMHGITAKDGRLLDRGTGLSKPTLLAALNILEERGIIESERQRSETKGDEPTIYRLRFRDGGKKTLPPVVKKFDQGGGQKDLPGPWPKNLTSQDTVPQDTVEQETDNIVVGPLVHFGVSKAVAAKLADTYPGDYILQKLEVAQWLVENRSPLVTKNPAGYLRRAIEEDYTPPKQYKSRAQRTSEEQQQQQLALAQQEQRRQAELQLAKVKKQANREIREAYPPQPVPGTSLTTETLWELVLDQLKHQLTKANFQMWANNTVLVSCNGRAALVAAPTQFQRNMLEKRLGPLITKALTAVVGTLLSCQYTTLAELTSQASHQKKSMPPKTRDRTLETAQ